MPHLSAGRPGHYLALAAVTALLTLPRLGAHTLWDIDEGLNAEAAREMLEAGTVIVPTFNYELRAAKPVMLYWCQMASYSLFGVSEWAARLPSALAALGTVLLVYELARRMFTPLTGLLAGLVCVSSFEVNLLAHAATPDSVLLVFSTLAFTLFYCLSRGGSRAWWLPTAAACGLAVMTKGPIGVGLPGLAILCFFAWNRELHRLWDRRIWLALLVFTAVALPWYVLVTVETKSAFLREFLFKQNVGRFMAPMENHSGPVVYHLVGLLVFFAPWSVLLGATLWYGGRQTAARRATEPLPAGMAAGVEESRAGVEAYRFLACWFGVVLVVFSLAATKLPNYVLPLYPALSILTARLLVRWATGALRLPGWVMPTAAGGLVFAGVGLGAACVILGRMVEIPWPKVPRLEGMRDLWWLPLVPLAGAAAFGTCLALRRRDRAVMALCGTAVAFTGSVGAFAAVALDRHKAPRGLVELADLDRPDEEIRIGALVWFQPSLVWYARREVTKLPDLPAANNFLRLPVPSYLLVDAKLYDDLKKDIVAPHGEVARRYDMYKNKDVLVLGNPAALAARGSASRAAVPGTGDVR